MLRNPANPVHLVPAPPRSEAIRPRNSGSPLNAPEPLLVLPPATDDLADHLCREATPMQEAGLPGTLLRVLRWLAEALAPNCACLLQFGPFEQSCGPLQHLTRHTLAPQIAQHAPCPIAAPRLRHVLFCEPHLGQPAAPLELVQQRAKLGGVGFRAVQFVGQFQARVLAAREQPQRAGAQAGYRPGACRSR
jgi:hypothetical protein